MRVRVLASVPSLLVLTSPLDMVCDLDLSVSDFEVDESQTLSVSTKRGHKQRKKSKANIASPGWSGFLSRRWRMV